MPYITPDTLALIAGHIAATLVAALPPPPTPVATTNDTVDAGVPKIDPVPVTPPPVDVDPALVAIAHKSVLLARIIADEVAVTEPVPAPVPLPWGRETRLPT